MWRKMSRVFAGGLWGIEVSRRPRNCRLPRCTIWYSSYRYRSPCLRTLSPAANLPKLYSDLIHRLITRRADTVAFVDRRNPSIVFYRHRFHRGFSKDSPCFFSFMSPEDATYCAKSVSLGIVDGIRSMVCAGVCENL